jgi:REP element-mobilizing transposase RayT
MSRKLRPNLPGMPFHLIARLQHGEALFVGIEDGVVHRLFEEVETAGIRLLAYAIMPNHLHLVAVQGESPLGVFMGSLLRRLALLVHRRHARQGHVFERPYRSFPCLDPEYLRTVIVYAHLNPVRAGLCEQPEAYAWTSHHRYGAAPAADGVGSPTLPAALQLFARECGQSDEQCRADYGLFITWRRAMDRFQAEDAELTAGPGRSPQADGGNLHWQLDFTPAGVPTGGPLLRRDLRDIVRDIAAAQDPPVPLSQLRAGTWERPMVKLRAEVIARCVQAGYTTSQIAAFLGVSTSSVSRVRAPLRRSCGF